LKEQSRERFANRSNEKDRITVRVLVCAVVQTPGTDRRAPVFVHKSDDHTIGFFVKAGMHECLNGLEVMVVRPHGHSGTYEKQAKAQCREDCRSHVLASFCYTDLLLNTSKISGIR
jgi:hypothetical protein